jgi:hypothetical protein
MTDCLLISEQKMREFTPLNNNVDSKLLTNCIIVQQDINIQRLLGTKLYHRLIDDVKANNVTGNYKILLEDWVQPSILWWGYYEILENVYSRVRNNGLLSPTGGENSKEVDYALYSRLRDSAKNKAEYYSELLARYLVAKQQLYPEMQSIQFLYQLYPDFSNQLRSPVVFSRNGRGYHAGQAQRIGLRIADSQYPQFPVGSNIFWGGHGEGECGY